jgi:deoxyribose-phosphate aldolase
MDRAQVEKIVEVVTREVLIALAEEERGRAHGHGDHCTQECADGLCVQMCYDRVGQVVSAGAVRVTSGLGMEPPEAKIAAMIDHTLLKPDVTPDQIAQLCYEARKYGFASVCVNPSHVKLCAALLQNSDV